MNELEVPILETKRLWLEPLSIAHTNGMFALWSNEKVIKYSGKIQGYDGNQILMPARQQTQSDLIIDFWIKAAESGWGLRWAVMFNDLKKSFAGTIGFNSLKDNYEIAFHLLPDYWGKGIMTEASTSIINWATKRNAESVIAFIEPENLPSVRLAERLGLLPTDEFSEGARKYSKLLRGTNV
jgi:[ribosomal protein S5]-alanine N-acetyltransferase